MQSGADCAGVFWICVFRRLAKACKGRQASRPTRGPLRRGTRGGEACCGRTCGGAAVGQRRQACSEAPHTGVLKLRLGVWRASAADTEIRPASAPQRRQASKLLRGPFRQGTRGAEACCGRTGGGAAVGQRRLACSEAPPSGGLKLRQGVWPASGADTDLRPATGNQPRQVSWPMGALPRRGTRGGEAC